MLYNAITECSFSKPVSLDAIMWKYSILRLVGFIQSKCVKYE